MDFLVWFSFDNVLSPSLYLLWYFSAIEEEEFYSKGLVSLKTCFYKCAFYMMKAVDYLKVVCDCLCRCSWCLSLCLCWPAYILSLCLSLCPPGQVPEEDLDEAEVDLSRAQAKPVCVNGTESKAKPERRSSSSSNPSRKGVSTASKIRKFSTCKQQWPHLNNPSGEKGVCVGLCVARLL